MVEEHSPEFVDAGEKQKIDFSMEMYILVIMIFVLILMTKKHFSISRDGTGRVRVHSQKKYFKTLDTFGR